MQQLESYFRALDGYLWLAQRMPHAFRQEEKARKYREAAEELINGALQDPPAAPEPRPRGNQRGKANKQQQQQPQQKFDFKRGLGNTNKANRIKQQIKGGSK